jgi:UDPglucose 6-dehydrogenase
VVGAGYVGLVCGAGFSEMGNRVWCVDADRQKIANLADGVVPIYEPGLEEMVRQNLDSGSLSFTASIEKAVAETGICFIAVGTPMGGDGGADLSQVLAVARDIGRYMDRHMVVVDKSTVPVGTAARVRKAIAGELAARGSGLSFDVVSNPEFLKEGAAVSDFMKPDRIVVGADSDGALAVMRELYAPFARNHDNFIAMDVESAEMTKYAANAMLATKISFMNEMANICELVGADVNKVRVGVGSDSRIGYAFLYPGCGYGGSCFPKDVRALIRTAGEFGYQPAILDAVEAVNVRQREIVAEKVVRRFGENLAGMAFAVWGLAFKPGTDDMREAPSVHIIRRLAGLGARIHAYDPRAIPNARALYLKDVPGVEYFASKYYALKDADALLLVTEWKEFRSPDFEEVRKLMRRPVIFDGRNQYDGARMAEIGFEYHWIGARPVVAVSVSDGYSPAMASGGC